MVPCANDLIAKRQCPKERIRTNAEVIKTIDIVYVCVCVCVCVMYYI